MAMLGLRRAVLHGRERVAAPGERRQTLSIVLYQLPQDDLEDQ
jgi:hypothetical protein